MQVGDGFNKRTREREMSRVIPRFLVIITGWVP